VAAGSGERLGAGGPKAFVPLAGRPLVEWSLDAFARASSIGPVIVAVPSGLEERIGGDAVAVPGGASRSESVAAGLERVETELIAVHDAARPLITAELIDEIVERLLDRPDAAAVIAAAPLTDTVKRAREPRPPKGEFPRGGPTVAQTMSRDHLWAAQTPQVFRTLALREALDTDPQRIAAATDDAMLVEKAGGKVLIQPSPRENLKVTTPLDLRVAELLLSGRA
jgi:2-C-methyl-D-erythritol 4-phosphate cytidylyltransferase